MAGCGEWCDIWQGIGYGLQAQRWRFLRGSGLWIAFQVERTNDLEDPD